MTEVFFLLTSANVYHGRKERQSSFVGLACLPVRSYAVGKSGNVQAGARV
jgi:hypothetical protein